MSINRINGQINQVRGEIARKERLLEKVQSLKLGDHIPGVPGSAKRPSGPRVPSRIPENVIELLKLFRNFLLSQTIEGGKERARWDTIKRLRIKEFRREIAKLKEKLTELEGIKRDRNDNLELRVKQLEECRARTGRKK